MTIRKELINRTNLVDRIDIKEKRHGFYGLGDMLAVFKVVDNQYYLHIHFIKKNIKIELTGDDAKETYMKYIDDSVDNSVNQIIKFAADSVNVNQIRLYNKTREPEIVCGRYLVFWAVIKYYKFNYSKAGRIFGQDRLTARRAFELMNSENIKFDIDFYEAKKRFLKIINTHDKTLLINN